MHGFNIVSFLFLFDRFATFYLTATLLLFLHYLTSGEVTPSPGKIWRAGSTDLFA
jgi:hypothetical protein